MSKKNDTNEIPATLTAPWVKRFFKAHYGIAVRVKTSKHYLNVWIQHHYDKENRHAPLIYKHEFPAELGNLCLRAVYPTSEQLCSQNWAGNIERHSLAMHDRQWREVMQKIIDSKAVEV